MISEVALCVISMRVLHGDLQIVHLEFRLFSTLHCAWCVNDYKSYLLLFNYSPKDFELLLVVVVSPDKAINQLLIIPAFSVNYCPVVFAFIQLI